MYIAMFFIWTFIMVMGIFIELNTQIQIGSGVTFGAMVALIVHGITWGDPLWIQFLIFVLVWIIFWLAFFLLFTLFKNKFSNKDDGLLKFVGKDFKVYKSNKNVEYGEIKINATLFRFKHKEDLKKGERVKIVSIDGVTCIVERI